MQTLTRVFLGRAGRDAASRAADDDIELYGRVASGAAGSFALKFSSTLLYFGIGVMLARALGTAGYGAYAYAMAWVALLGVPALLGLDNLVVRESSVLRAGAAWGPLRGLLAFANRAVLGASLVLVLLGWGIAAALADRLDAATLDAMRVVVLLLPLVVLTRVRQATLQSFDRVVSGQLPEALLAPGLVFGLVVATRAFGWPLTPAWAVGFNLAGAALAFVIGTRLLKSALPAEISEARPEQRGREWLRSALPLLFVAGMHIVNSRTDMLMLGALRDAEEVGVYGVANRGGELIAFLLIAANPALAPVVARVHAAGDDAGLQQLLTRSARLILLASLPVAVLMIGFGDWFLALFGPGFVQGRTALAILGAGQLVNVATGPVGMLLIMTGHERDAARGVAIAAVSNVVLNGLLIPRYGPEGAAAATAASLVLWNLLLAFWVVRRTGLHPTALGPLPARAGAV